MKWIFGIFLWLILGQVTLAQKIDSIDITLEQQLENIAENNENEIEDDAYLQELQHLKKNPLNLNVADASALQQFKVLNSLQINNFISYRRLLGHFISVYELQAIPGWDPDTIDKLRPYIIVSSSSSLSASLRERFKTGDHVLLLRVAQVMERSAGYRKDSAEASAYKGSPQRLLFRYRFNHKNTLQYGLLGEKDPGETFFKGTHRKGFDFYSAHLFVRRMGMIKAFALGDYTVNLGQGLIHWQSLAFRKGADVLNTKRQSAILKPYNASGEINFHRGIALTIGRNKWESTFFASLRKLDANLIVDSGQEKTVFVSSLQVSGYHRTDAELADNYSQSQSSLGGNFSYKWHKLKVGLNAVNYAFKVPVRKDDLPYNKFAFSGKRLSNYSFDYGYTLRNMHFFGEAAISNKKATALINGLLISTAENVDISILYRDISAGYQALYTNAFTENAQPTNERGLFIGLLFRPAAAWRLSAYTDMFKFPILRFRVNGPSVGQDYFVQVHYKPGKKFEVYSRFKFEAKGLNHHEQDVAISPVKLQIRKNWRSQFFYQINRAVAIRSRVEMGWANTASKVAEQAFLIYQDVLYKPLASRITGSVRLMFFETGGYDSRVYAYENDVLYSHSIPVFYDKGFRYYVNLQYAITRDCTIWFKWGQSRYREKSSLGSGLDAIQGNRKTEIKVQGIYVF